MRAVVHVFTYRDGLLAKLAHDLRLTLGEFEIRVERGEVRAWFDPASLRVDGVAHGETLDGDTPSAEDKRKIEETIRREVLESDRFPRVELSGTLQVDGSHSQGVVEARLQLHGQEQALRIPFRGHAGGLSADITFAPSQFGIKAYKALGGAIRTADRLRVRVVADDANIEALAANPITFRPNE